MHKGANKLKTTRCQLFYINLYAHLYYPFIDKHEYLSPENYGDQESGRQHHKGYNTDAGNHNYYVTHDGITLPPCDEIPDASQADNGNRCWFE